MISAFDVAPLGRWQGLCYVNRVQLGLTEKNLKKNGKSWYGEIKPIFSQMGKLELSV